MNDVTRPTPNGERLTQLEERADTVEAAVLQVLQEVSEHFDRCPGATAAERERMADLLVRSEAR